MKDRINVLAGALLSLLLVYVLLTPKGAGFDSDRISRPTSIDDGEYGLLGLKTWLEQSDVRTLSWRRRYDRLADDEKLPSRGNFLITSLPHGLPARARELKSLRDWLAQGNYALILAAEYDHPDWAMLGLMRFASFDTEEVLQQFGFEFRDPESEQRERKEQTREEGQEPAGGRDREKTSGFFRRLLREDPAEKLSLPRREAAALVPVLRHPRTRSVNDAETGIYVSSTGKTVLAAAEDSVALALGLLKNPATGQTVFWESPLGQGGIWLSAYPDLFGNATLGRADNSKLLANLLEFALGPDGYVVFDDFHFGISELYDAQAFFADRRLHVTLLFILGFWFLYLLGHTNRLRPPATPVHPPRASDFIEALAGLCARRLTGSAIVRGLIGHFFNEVRALHRLPENGQPAWEPLATRLPPGSRDLDAFRAMVAGCEHGQPPRPGDLISVLQKLRKELR